MTVKGGTVQFYASQADFDMHSYKAMKQYKNPLTKFRGTEWKDSCQRQGCI